MESCSLHNVAARSAWSIQGKEMSTIKLGRVHMTVKVMDDKVEYRPKECKGPSNVFYAQILVRDYAFKEA